MKFYPENLSTTIFRNCKFRKKKLCSGRTAFLISVKVFPEFAFFIRPETKSIPSISSKLIDSFVKIGLVKAVLKYVDKFLSLTPNAVSSRYLQLIRIHALTTHGLQLTLRFLLFTAGHRHLLECVWIFLQEANFKTGPIWLLTQLPHLMTLMTKFLCLIHKDSMRNAQ